MEGPQEARTSVRDSRNALAAPPSVVEERLQALSARLLRQAGASAKAQDLLKSSSTESPAVAFERAAIALSSGQEEIARKVMDSGPFAAETHTGPGPADRSGATHAAGLAGPC